jgi:dihydrofolate reductase
VERTIQQEHRAAERRKGTVVSAFGKGSSSAQAHLADADIGRRVRVGSTRRPQLASLGLGARLDLGPPSAGILQLGLRQRRHDLAEPSHGRRGLSRPLAPDSRTAEQHKGDPEYGFARKITDAEKVVATSKRLSSRWEKTTIASGDLRDIVIKLKQGDGSDIISFGGTGFAETLIAYGLADELQLFVNPTAVGAGKSIFGSAQNHGLRLSHITSQAYACGIVVNRYALKN